MGGMAEEKKGASALSSSSSRSATSHSDDKTEANPQPVTLVGQAVHITYHLDAQAHDGQDASRLQNDESRHCGAVANGEVPAQSFPSQTRRSSDASPSWT